MNERIKELAQQCYDPSEVLTSFEKFAELLVKDCADFIRETYDDRASESIAFNLEMHYGLHGDYV